jgi:hypothetical protein
VTTTTTNGHTGNVTHVDVADLMDDHAETSPVTPITAPEPAPSGGGEDDDGKTPLPVRLARLVLDHHWMVVDGGRLYGVPRDGGAVVRQLRGGSTSRGSIRQWVQKQCMSWGQGVSPGKDTLAQAMDLVEAMSEDAPEVPVHVRAGEDRTGNGTWLDLGRPDGRCLHIMPGSWEVRVPTAREVLFRRTTLVSEIPEPVRPDDALWDAGIREFADLINVGEDQLPMLAAWLIATMRSDIPVPVLFILGEQGTGKSTATRLMRSVTDLSPARSQSSHNNERDMSAAVRNGWIYATDNNSVMPAWLSDELCRLVTGDSKVNRALYSDDDVVVLQYRRPVIINSIDLAGLRADLADRMAAVRLSPIADAARRSDADVERAFAEAHPRILGSLATLASKVLAEIPAAWETIHYRPRMIDYAVILHAIDRVTGSSGLDRYAAARESLSSDVVHSNTVAEAIIRLVRQKSGGRWEGTPQECLDQLNLLGSTSSKSWPRTTRALGGELQRIVPEFRKLGWEVNLRWRPRDPDGKQRMKYLFVASDAGDD